VLEELWLPARNSANGAFFKAWIQLAGAFVHLQKHRLRPAAALFALAEANLSRYPDMHLGFDVASARRLIATWHKCLTESSYTWNPLGDSRTSNADSQ
jgi:hypothetical protein